MRNPEGGRYFLESSNHNIPHIPPVPQAGIQKGGKGSFLEFLENKHHAPSRKQEPRLPIPNTPLSPDNNKVRGPTEREIRRAKTVKGELRHEGGRVGPYVLTFVGGAAIGVGGGYLIATEVFASNNPSEIPIGSFPNSFNNDGSVPKIQISRSQSEQPKKPNKDEVFDNTAIEGVISEKSIVRLPQEEIDRLFPTAFGKLGEDNTTLQLLYPLDLSESTKPNDKIKFTKRLAGGPQIVLEGYQNHSDTFHVESVPEGTIVNSPVDGYLIILYDTDVRKPSNGSNSDGAIIVFQSPEGNYYRLAIVGGTKVSPQDETAFVFQSLTNAPRFTPENNGKVVGTYGTRINKGQPILKIVESSYPIDFGLRISVARKGQVGKPVDRTQPQIPTNIEFLTTPDGKLIVPQK